MGYNLTGDQHKIVSKKLGEIQRQLGQEQYPFDPDNLIGALQAIVEGRFEAMGGRLYPSQIYADDLIPEYTNEKGNKKKWKIVDDVQPSMFKISDLERVSFMEDRDGLVYGYEIRKRAVRLEANLGLVYAKYMLYNQSEIPVEFREKCLIFTGTLLCDPIDRLHMAYLRWSDNRWNLRFIWVLNDWNDDGNLLRSKSR